VRVDFSLSAVAPAAFTYLRDPVVSVVSPIAVRASGGSTLTLQGLNFGYRGSGVPIRVTLTAGAVAVMCQNPRVVVGDVSVVDLPYTNSTIECTTVAFPTIDVFDLTLDLDGNSVFVAQAVRSLAVPTVAQVSPNKGYVATPTQLTITGANFGPLSGTGLAPTLEVWIGSARCTNAVVTVEDTEIQCTSPTVLGSGQVVVIVDDVLSTEPVYFTNFADAGRFMFQDAVFNILETQTYVDIPIVRISASYLSAASVVVSLLEGDATSPHYFIASRQTVQFSEDATLGFARFAITAASRYQVGPRKGVADDRFAYLRLEFADSEFGVSTVEPTPVPLYIRAICEVVTDDCYAGISSDGVSYYRLDGYDQFI